MCKIAQFFIVALVIYLLQSCNSSSKNREHKERSNIEYKGFYIYGHEVNSFSPCHNTKAYWITGKDTTLRRLKNKYKTLTTDPYQNVYLSFRGHVTDELPEGFARDYDGQIIVHEVTAMEDSTKAGCK